MHEAVQLISFILEKSENENLKLDLSALVKVSSKE